MALIPLLCASVCINNLVHFYLDRLQIYICNIDKLKKYNKNVKN